MWTKSVILLSIAGVLVSGHREGSGGNYLSDDSDDYIYDGSGDSLDKLLLVPDDMDDSKEKDYDIKFYQDYDDDLNDYIYSDDYDSDLTLEVDDDSVLKISEVDFLDEQRIIEEKMAEVDIQTKPDEKVVLETSHILIMVGSAFVSFGVAMLSFYLCRKSMEKRKQKLEALSPKKPQEEEPSPIVKNYQRVPTDTKEYLENKDTHIDMARDEEEKQNDPLIN